MRRVPYRDVLAQAALLYTGKSTVTSEIGAGLRIWINRLAQHCWRRNFWPEWTPTQQRWFAPIWQIGSALDASTATDPVWRFYPPEQKYYQALSDTTEEPTQGDTWAEAAASYSGDYHDLTGTYVAGDVVQSPYDERFYQAWTTPAGDPVPGADPNVSGWGVLTPWRPIILRDQPDQDQIDAVYRVYDADPEVDRSAASLRWTQTDTGFLIQTTLPTVWIKFRKQPPEWSGDTYSASTTYAADDQVWDSTTGDYYRSLSGSNTGHPVTNTEYWERIDFPWILRNAVASAAAEAAKGTDTSDSTAAWANVVRVAEAFLLPEIMEISNRQPSSGDTVVRA